MDFIFTIKIPLLSLFFIFLQIIQNACATIAIINLLLNLPSDSGIKLGKILEDFQNFTQDFDQMVLFLKKFCSLFNFI